MDTIVLLWILEWFSLDSSGCTITVSFPTSTFRPGRSSSANIFHIQRGPERDGESTHR